MNKFTNNAYNFINGCIGFSINYEINIRGDYTYHGGLGALWNHIDLKQMIIIEIEIQSNKIFLEVIKNGL